MKEYKCTSPAKINLTLEVIERLPNGFHALRTVMMTLPHLYDDMVIQCDDRRDDITIVCDNGDVPTDEKNICHKVARAYCETIGKKIGMDIAITKRIPLAAGLGGGSSNGAHVLLSLNEYCGSPLSQEALIDVAAVVGKDIPFFFTKKNCALIEGMGERITEEYDMNTRNILIVNPGIAVPTPWAFGQLKHSLWYMTDSARVDKSRALLTTAQRGEDIAPYVYNDFEPAIGAHYPIIFEIVQIMKAYGARGAAMSGSGSTVFGIFASQRDLHVAQEKIVAQFPAFLVIQG